MACPALTRTLPRHRCRQQLQCPNEVCDASCTKLPMNKHRDVAVSSVCRAPPHPFAATCFKTLARQYGCTMHLQHMPVELVPRTRHHANPINTDGVTHGTTALHGHPPDQHKTYMHAHAPCIAPPCAHATVLHPHCVDMNMHTREQYFERLPLVLQLVP
jgi:hypothetical protein